MTIKTRALPTTERLARLSMPEPNSGCALWLAQLDKAGYGRMEVSVRRFRMDGVSAGSRPAHRIAYEVAYGPIPPSTEIDHLCNNRSCVNPTHLEAVSRQVNMARAIARRAARGLPWGRPRKIDHATEAAS